MTDNHAMQEQISERSQYHLNGKKDVEYQVHRRCRLSQAGSLDTN